MARYKDWKPTAKDVGEINTLIEEVVKVRREAFESLIYDVGLDSDTALSLLPEMGNYEVSTVGDLHDEFATRADFNREKSRLRRIISAGRGKPRRNVVSIAPDNPNQLTSFYVDESGNILESQYARKEQSFLRSQENRRNIAALQAQGIEFERKEVRDSVTGKALYDENRHKITVMVPKTPSMLEAYRETIQRRPERAVSYGNVPSEGVIDMWGDEAPVSVIERAPMSMHAMRNAVEVDAKAARRTELYFDNYQTLVDTTMPKGISDEIDMYIGEIKRLSPSEQSDMYEFIYEGEDDAGSMEYLYWDTTLSLPAKMQNIINFWRTKVAPKLGMTEREKIELTAVEQDLGEYGYQSNGLYPIFAEYQRRRADEPKGKWRKRFRDA